MPPSKSACQCSEGMANQTMTLSPCILPQMTAARAASCMAAAQICWCLAFTGAVTVHAQEDRTQRLQQAERLHSKCAELFEEGEYSEAIALAKQALSIRQDLLGPDDLRVATTLNILAGLR